MADDHMQYALHDEEEPNAPSEPPSCDGRVVGRARLWRVGSREAALKGRSEPPDAVEAASVNELLALVHEESRMRRARRRSIPLRVAIVIGVIVLAAALSPVNPGGFIGITSVAITGAFAISPRHKRVIEALAKHDDLRAIGPLTDVLVTDDRHLQSRVAVKLAALLPRLQASDAHLLAPAQHRILDRYLRSRKHPALAVAILKAYEQVGDARSLPAVERLADGRGRGRHDRRLRAAADACLPYLRARAQAERDAQTLLRPASGPGEADPAVLLRPAEPGS
jgi:hypothetical protein